MNMIGHTSAIRGNDVHGDANWISRFDLLPGGKCCWIDIQQLDKNILGYLDFNTGQVLIRCGVYFCYNHSSRKRTIGWRYDSLIWYGLDIHSFMDSAGS